MQLTRDLFPTDGRAPYFTLTLQSRDPIAHSLLSTVTDENKTRIEEAMAAAVTAITRILREAGAEELRIEN